MEVEVIGEVPLRLETQQTRDSVPVHRTSTHARGSESSSRILNNRARAVLAPLEHHEPSTTRGSMLVATITTTDVAQEIKQLGNGVVGYYCDGKNTRAENTRASNVKRYVRKKWKDFGPFKTYELQPAGFFLFKFKHGADKHKLLQHPQWLIDNRPFILKCWKPNLQLDPLSFLSSIPIWVKFPNLDLQFYSKASLAKISRLLGEPLFADEATSQRERLQYARVCIEIKLGAKLPKSVLIRMDGDQHTIEQSVKYEWKPQLCTCCSSLAVDSSAVKNFEKEVRPKGKLNLLTMMGCAPGNSPEVEEFCHVIRKRN